MKQLKFSNPIWAIRNVSVVSTKLPLSSLHWILLQKKRTGWFVGNQEHRLLFSYLFTQLTLAATRQTPASREELPFRSRRTKNRCGGWMNWAAYMWMAVQMQLKNPAIFTAVCAGRTCLFWCTLHLRCCVTSKAPNISAATSVSA